MYPTQRQQHGSEPYPYQQHLPNGLSLPLNGGYLHHTHHSAHHATGHEAAVNQGSPEGPPSDADQLAVFENWPSSPVSDFQHSLPGSCGSRLRCPIEAAGLPCPYTGDGFPNISKTREHVALKHPSFCPGCEYFIGGSQKWNLHKDAITKGQPCPTHGRLDPKKVNPEHVLLRPVEFLNNFHSRQAAVDWPSLYRQMHDLTDDDAVPSQYHTKKTSRASEPTAMSMTTSSPSPSTASTGYAVSAAGTPGAAVPSIQSVLHNVGLRKSMFEEDADTPMGGSPCAGPSQVHANPSGAASTPNVRLAQANASFGHAPHQSVSTHGLGGSENTPVNHGGQSIPGWSSFPPEHLESCPSSDPDAAFDKYLKNLEQLTVERDFYKSRFEEVSGTLNNMRIQCASELTNALDEYSASKASDDIGVARPFGNLVQDTEAEATAIIIDRAWKAGDCFRGRVLQVKEVLQSAFAAYFDGSKNGSES